MARTENGRFALPEAYLFSLRLQCCFQGEDDSYFIFKINFVKMHLKKYLYILNSDDSNILKILKTGTLKIVHP